MSRARILLKVCTTRLVAFLLFFAAGMLSLSSVAFGLVDANLAAAMGDIEEVRSLVLAHPERIEERTVTGMTPLMSAAASGEMEVIRYLISQAANVHAVDNQGWTALKHAERNNHREIASFLIESGADRDVNR